jgi:hypothetical protein
VPQLFATILPDATDRGSSPWIPAVPGGVRINILGGAVLYMGGSYNGWVSGIPIDFIVVLASLEPPGSTDNIDDKIALQY